MKDPFLINGDYMYKYSYGMIILFMIDIAIVSLLYFMVGLTFSAWFNDEIIGPLDRDLGNLVIFIECISEILLTVVAVYFVLHFLPKLPCVVPNPPPEHMIFRTRGADVLLAFSIVAAQLLYLDKLRFLYNEVKDANEAATLDILGNWQICEDGGVALPGQFECSV